jgi:hypothetical protein
VTDAVAILEFSRHHVRFGIGQASTARQRHEQGALFHVEAKSIVERVLFLAAHAAVGGTLERMPKPQGCAVGSAELTFEVFNFGI